MSFEAALKSQIEAATQRPVYPLLLPQRVTLPASTYQVISETRVRSQDGDSRLPTTRVQVDHYADTYSAAAEMDRQLVARLAPGRGTYGQLIAENIIIESATDDIDPITLRYRRTRDYLLTHKEVL